MQDPCAALSVLWHVQVWPGALLLADYILAQEELFSDCVALEVGAGTGFAGLVLARTARRVFLTDHNPAILANCQRDVEENKHLFRQGPDVARVRCLNLFHALPSTPGRRADTKVQGIANGAQEGKRVCYSSQKYQTLQYEPSIVGSAVVTAFNMSIGEKFCTPVSINNRRLIMCPTTRRHWSIRGL